MHALRIKRVYAPAHPDDGLRVLVDRVWPRGLTREQVAADRWLRALAPSTELRRWFGHDPARWDEFRQRYFRELEGQGQGAAVAELRAALARGPVTLLYSARDEARNQAVALRAYLLAG